VGLGFSKCTEGVHRFLFWRPLVRRRRRTRGANQLLELQAPPDWNCRAHSGIAGAGGGGGPKCTKRRTCLASYLELQGIDPPAWGGGGPRTSSTGGAGVGGACNIPGLTGWLGLDY
jgi:hypothetical protein